MKNYLFVFVFMVLAQWAVGQGEQAINKRVGDQFEALYNAEAYDSIFHTFTPEMQLQVPRDKTREFLGGLRGMAGKMVRREFLKYEGPYASYKAIFEKGTFSLNLAVAPDGQISGMNVRPLQVSNLPTMERNITPLSLPFKGEWTVFWGGDTKELNYHVVNQAQKNAFDIMIMDDKGNSFKTDGKTNEDYYAFGKELIAPCAGEVVLAVDGIKDNVPGVLNPIYVPGNTVVIRTDKNEYLFFAHFKQHSIVVKQGQKVKRGQLLGQCGNTGNSSEPHLHFHIQNAEEMTVATGVKCYFEKLKVNGVEKTDYSPIKNDKIIGEVK